MSGVKHLWEVDHPYYCRQEAWNSGEVSTNFDMWASFEAEFKDADFDMNLLFRFDWEEGTAAGAGDFTGDVYYRNGIFKAFWMGQRKGLFWCNTVSVCRADEPAVLAFLQPRLDYLAALWSPLIPALGGSNATSE